MMRQLTGLDATFTYIEDDHQPQHIGSLGIYDPSTAPGNIAATYEDIIASIKKRAYLAPLMRQRLHEVPFNMDHPYWLRVADFNAEDHIYQHTLPDPGNWQALCELVSRLHEGMLDRSRPLWEIHLVEGLDAVEGLPDGAIGVYTKIHHAALDGVAGVQLAMATHDFTPEGDEKPEPGLWQVDPEPVNWELLAKAQLKNSLQPFQYMDFLAQSAPHFADAMLGMASGKFPAPQLAPRTRFNGSVSRQRVYDGILTTLDELRAIKSSVPGATINDVVLSICGGALRKYLSNLNELPDQPLLAMAPVNVRTKDETDTAGNQISEMTIGLGTHEDDALKRLKVIAAETAKAKELVTIIGPKTLTEYSQFMPGAFTAAATRLSSQFGMAEMIPPVFNCVVTNVPGAPVPLYSLGSKLVQTWGLGPLTDACGLFHSVSSYCDDITISACSCPKMMPEPSVYMQGMQETLDELKSATVSSKPRQSRARKGPAKAASKSVRSRKRKVQQQATP
jgi:WS/DGAT/MGAT family acyltransferase